MKVLVLNNMVPLLRGGAEALVDEIVRWLNGAEGVQAQLVPIPVDWEAVERLIDGRPIRRPMRLSNTDLMIGLKFPAYLDPHPRKRLRRPHQFRQPYALWDTEQSNIPRTPP